MEKDHQEKHIVNHFEAGSNCQVFTAPVSGCVFAMPGSTVIQKADSPKPVTDEKQADVAMLVECVGQVRDYFWSKSALAIVFCVCRDCFNYPSNMRQFERDFQCPEGLLANAFRNNPYMRLRIDKWAQNGAKDRVLRLLEAYKNAVMERLNQ